MKKLLESVITGKMFLSSNDSFMSSQITNLKKYLKQWSPVKHIFSVRILLCLFKSQIWKNYLKQSLHVRHFFITDSFMSLQVTNLKKYLKQWSHVKHISSVRILLCLFKSPTWNNYLKQWSHAKHFSLIFPILYNLS